MGFFGANSEWLNSQREYTDCSLRFDCRTCETSVSRRELISRHVHHDYRPNTASLKEFAWKVETHYREQFSKIIRDINKARRDFLSRAEALEVSMEISSRSIMFGELWKAEPSRILTDTTHFFIQSWNRQMEICRSYMNLCSDGWLKSKSLNEIANAVVQMNKDLDKVKNVESCDLSMEGSEGMGLGKVRLSPSPEKTTVEVDGMSAVNKLNTCTVTVRDAVGNIVEGGVQYELSVILIDPDDNPVDVVIENKRNGFFSVKYFPTVTGHHGLCVLLNSVPVSNGMMDIWVGESSRAEVKVFGEAGKGDSQFARPWGVCIDGYGRIYVSDRSNHRIQVFDEKGEFIRKFGQEGSKPGELKVPAGIAIDKNQRLIVADKDNHRIQIFFANGEYVCHFGRFETEEESLYYPWDVAVDGNGRIAVTEGFKRRVTLFTDSGTKLAVCIFSRELDLDHPRGISCTSDGSFLVTDFNKHKIVLLDKNLNALATLGSSGKDIDKLSRPQGIAVGGNGLFAVSDCKNQRIKIFRDNLLFRIITDDFECIQGVAFHPNGSVVVIEKEKCQVKIVRFESIYPSDEYFADATDL